MSNISLPLYDDCRKWIKTARERELSWEKIRFAGKLDERELKIFLNNQIECNFWPENLDTQTWFEIVASEQNAEKKWQELIEQGRRAVLTDNEEDSEVSIPSDERSSWQLYRNHLLSSGWKTESVEEIERATIGLLKRLSNDTATTGPIKGLVIGHVQSGKTANMAALMAMAADWGWNMFVVLSGTIENLRKQTQSRLHRDLNRPGNINWAGLEHLSKQSPMGQRAQDLRFEESSSMRYFTVCLKNATRLRKLIEWIQFDPNKQKQMKIIVIDDEADQGSINTADTSSDERTQINGLIVDLVEGNKPKGLSSPNKPKAMNYISYTATPYANFLNESGRESLYPRNFIRALQPSDEYFGPKQIFGIQGTEECDGLNIVRTISKDDLDEIKQIHDGESVSLPGSLKDALCWFLCTSAAMRVFGYTKPISMLVHTSQKQQHHSEVAETIEAWLRKASCSGRDKLIGMCEKLWEKETSAFTLQDFRKQYPGYGREDSEINQYPQFSKIASQIELLIDEISHIPLGEDGELRYHGGIHLCVDNCANNGVNDDGMFVRLAYPDPDKKPYPSPAPVFIVVGGSTLSRGLTIEGLTSTYFLRASCQADTLMQMGRWFGYRKGYELLPRIWMTQDTLEKFEFLTVLEMELRDDLYRFMVGGADPSKFGPRVKNSPSTTWLRITAKNRMQGAQEIEMDFTGTNSQTTIFSNSREVLEENTVVTEKFLNGLSGAKVSFSGNALVWRNIGFDIIRNEFLSKFKFNERSRVFNQIGAFSDWFEKVSEEANFKNWNVVAAGIGTVNSPASQWELREGSLGKVTRSRKKTNRDDNSINIGVLRAPKDLLADIDISKVSRNSQENLKKGIATTETEKYRTEAGLDKTPQLLIYRIDKDSKARDSANGDRSSREDLNALEDIIGISIVIPGVPPAGDNLAKALTVKLNKDDMDTESDLEGTE